MVPTNPRKIYKYWSRLEKEKIKPLLKPEPLPVQLVYNTALILICSGEKRTLKTVIDSNIIYITPTDRPAKRSSEGFIFYSNKGIRVSAACTFDPKLPHLDREFQ